MNFVCIVFELGDKILTLSSMENLIVPCNHIWAWPPSWSCDPIAVNKFSFPLLKEAQHKICLWSAKRFLRRRCLSIVDRWTMDGPTMGIL